MKSKRLHFISVLLLISSSVLCQTNCNLYEKDSNCYIACEEVNKSNETYSGSASFQKHLLKAIKLCPSYHYAYFELSVNYAKRGLLSEWKPLIDKAVELSPQDHLGWRAWYHWFFAHNYEAAIEDINQLEKLVSYDIGTTGDGLYHLTILKALCYDGLGKTGLAIETMNQCMNTNPEYFQGSFDYLHLAALYLKVNQPEKALAALKTQEEFYDMSEVHFYRAKAMLQLSRRDEAIKSFRLALEKYDEGLHMHDPYRQLPDEIYRSDIESAISNAQISN